MADEPSVPEIVRETGLSRSTVYRRLKRGESASDILGRSTNEVELPAEIAYDGGDSAVEWCEAVLWAAEHVNEAKMTRQKAGSLIKFSLWQFGRDNTKELVVNLVPKALTMLDKNKKPDEQAAAEAAERKDIRDLQELLEGALQEAGLAG